MSEDTLNLDVLILCGGKGTRLKPIISDKPKGLAPIGDRPFIDTLFDYLKASKVRRVILCIGHLKEQYKEYLKFRSDIEVVFSEEDEPLGTAGALKNAIELIKTDPFIVINGDSICKVSLLDFYSDFKMLKSDLAIVLSSATEGNDYGNVKIDKNRKLISFDEKLGESQESLKNAGVYLLSKKVAALLPDSAPSSIEKDYFPLVIKSHYCSAYVVNETVFDIGTPERYAILQKGIVI